MGRASRYRATMTIAPFMASHFIIRKYYESARWGQGVAPLLPADALA
jgi:hypothetical protein